MSNPVVQADGTTKVKIGSQTFTLRRPTFGQYKTLRRIVYAMPDEVREIVGGVDDDPDRPNIEVAEATDAVTIEFWAKAFELLGENGATWPYPDVDNIPDDAPLWIIDPAVVGVTLREIRSRPAVPGSQ